MTECVDYSGEAEGFCGFLGCGAICLCLLQMKVSDRQSPAEKGHLNFDKRCCAPQTHREPFGDAGRHAKPSPDYTRGLLAFWAAAAQANLHPRQTKPSPSREQTFIYLRYSEDLRPKKRKEEKTNSISDKTDSVLLSSWQSTLSPSAGTCK